MQKLMKLACGVAAAAALYSSGAAAATPVRPDVPAEQISDAALVKRLPGFSNREALVNGIRLHYVIGGEGPPVVLLPGWPQTWWAWHKIMPELARRHTVIAVDIRGMGGTDKPACCYDTPMSGGSPSTRSRACRRICSRGARICSRRGCFVT